MNGHEKKNSMEMKEVDNASQYITITMDGKVKSDQPKLTSEDVRSKNTMCHIFDQLNLNYGEDDTVGQRPTTGTVMDTEGTNNNLRSSNYRLVDLDFVEEDEQKTRDICDTKKDLGPILEYAEEPLLSLDAACAPLTDILHDLSSYVKLALDETPEIPPDGLTIDESASIRLYTLEWSAPHRSLYSMLNHTLKKADRKDLRPYFKYLKLFLTALVKLPCIPQQAVWRGVKKNLSEDFSSGTLVTWWAFSSCTTALPVLDNNIYLGKEGKRTLFYVEAINSRAISGHSHFVTEDEVLLLPGTYMEVMSQFSPATDLQVIHLQQIKPVEVLLELPFEGNR